MREACKCKGSSQVDDAPHGPCSVFRDNVGELTRWFVVSQLGAEKHDQSKAAMRHKWQRCDTRKWQTKQQLLQTDCRLSTACWLRGKDDRSHSIPIESM